MAKHKKIDKYTEQQILQEAVKAAAKIKAFPRRLTLAQLNTVVATANEAQMYLAKKRVHHMNNRLRLIRIGGITVIILGILFIFLSASSFLIASIISIGCGIVLGAAFFGWATGVFEVSRMHK